MPTPIEASTLDTTRIDDVRIAAVRALVSPAVLLEELPVTPPVEALVETTRQQLGDLLHGRDDRLAVVVGPCSIHDFDAALAYARLLQPLADALRGELAIVMRVYFEKPRTSTGWKGFINDPYMDDSFRIEEGIEKARAFLLKVAELGLPTATEALDPITPQYLGDLVAWTAIGARTSESQTHREMASGLSTPVGFKNGTDGDIQVAINAIQSAARPHSFLGLSFQGRSAIVRTQGNTYSHMVLRGGGGRPNYDTVSISITERALAKAGLPRNIVVDCSHANSYKDVELQPLVMSDCVHQVREGNRSIVGLMIESNLEAGNQPIPDDLSQLKYGCSVTDPCVDWPTTEAMIRKARENLRDILPQRVSAKPAA
jgi:3-deoxy-7-phosphoheptulonate synthase